MSDIVRADPWSALRTRTAARIALGRAGASLPTQEVLQFGLAHAQARDAVHVPLDGAKLESELQADGWTVLNVHSQASSRNAYLARPDWGRSLHPDSAALLKAQKILRTDIVFVVSDGLSSVAVQRHAAPLLRAMRPLLQGLHIAPLVLATQARVALADEVGELLQAKLAVSLIGERPGLSSPDSLGLYLTWQPRRGRTDAERNCISNIRPEGLPITQAALQLAALAQAALQLQMTGVSLSTETGATLTHSKSKDSS